MTSDLATSLLAFLAVFGTLGAYLWSLASRARRLEERLRALEDAATTKK